jgi:hypothetical protein
MLEEAKPMTDFVSDLSPETFVATLLVALVIAVVTAGVYRGLARRKPVTLTLLVCLVLLANLFCMLVTVGFVQSKVPTVRLIVRAGGLRRDRSISMYDHISQPDAASDHRAAPQMRSSALRE